MNSESGHRSVLGGAVERKALYWHHCFAGIPGGKRTAE